MSSHTTAMPLYLAESAALELQRLLNPVCKRVAVAGSVRRHADVCGDVEIVAIPHVDQATKAGDLFPSDVDRLAELMEIVARGDHPLIFKPKPREGQRAPPWGPRQKKLFLKHQRRWIAVDLWITTRRQWGSIFAIRTGDKEFSHRLVTQQIFGGAMPANMKQADGALHYIAGYTDDGPNWQAIYTHEEADFFEAIGLPVLNPEERTETNLKRLLAERDAGRPLSH